MDSKLLYLIPLALLLFSFKKKTPAKKTACIYPGNKPIYGGKFVAKLKPGTKIFDTPGGKVIFQKGCYVEVLDQVGLYSEIVNRTAINEPDFTGYILTSAIESVVDKAQLGGFRFIDRNKRIPVQF